MTSNKNELLRRLARLGAMRRITEMQAEANEIYRQFPDLRIGASPASTSTVRETAASGVGAVQIQRRKRRKMTAAERRAVGARMKNWAARKKAASK